MTDREWLDLSYVFYGTDKYTVLERMAIKLDNIGRPTENDINHARREALEEARISAIKKATEKRYREKI